MTARRHPETMKNGSGTSLAGQAVPAPYPSDVPGRNCRELAPPVPQLELFHGRPIFFCPHSKKKRKAKSVAFEKDPQNFCLEFL